MRRAAAKAEELGTFTSSHQRAIALGCRFLDYEKSVAHYKAVFDVASARLGRHHMPTASQLFAAWDEHIRDNLANVQLDLFETSAREPGAWSR